MATTAPPANSVLPHPDQAAALQKLKVWGKLAKGELHTITKRDVEELFAVLDTEERGEISPDDLLVLRTIPDLSLTAEDIESLVEDADKDKSGKVSQEELFKALTQGEIAYNVVLASLGQRKAVVKTTECDKDDLIEFLRCEYEIKTALWSLPQTAILFVTFLISMTVHIGHETTGFSMQQALQGEIEGEGKPYLYSYVHDVPTFWEWMTTSFVTCHFKSAPGNLEIWPYPGRVASYNQIIGGVQVTRVSSEPGTCLQSETLRTFYDSRFGGRCHKQDDTEVTRAYLFYHEHQEAIQQQIMNLSLAGWVDQNTTQVDIDILFYNAHLKAFTQHVLTFLFSPNGVVRIRFGAETFLADPYSNILWIIPDLIFGLILLRMFYSEMLELVPACMTGLDGFLQYMQFWNIIDWFAIIVGVAVATLWVLVMVTVTTDLQEKIADLNVQDLDRIVFVNGTYLSPAQFEEVMPKESFTNKIHILHNLVGDVARKHEWVRWLSFGYNFVLMMKFFKAFQANPRLNIVIKTMQTSSTDIIHFFIVFAFIFIVFSSSAHVYFGSKIKEFSSQLRSLMMCWRILMGEFDVDAMELVDQILAYSWMFVFQFLVLLILLNMLLAIIMDTYAAVNQPGAETIWAQIKDALNTARETRGHLDMWYLICEFEDEDYNVHPRDRVTSKSLRAAFESQKMTKHNADYLIRKTAEFVRAKEAKTELKMSDAVRIISRMQTTTLRTQESVDVIVEMMKEDRRRPQEERFDAIMAGQDPDLVQRRPLQRAAPMPVAPLALPGAVPSAGQWGMAVPGGPGGGGGGGNSSDLMAIHQAAAQRRMSVQSNIESRRASFSQSMGNYAVPARQMPGSNAGAGAADNGILAYLDQLQTTLDGMRSDQLRIEHEFIEELHDTRAYIEQRDAWLEQRLNSLDRRYEKVERASERVSSALKGFDFEELMSATDRVAHFLQIRQHGFMPNGSGRLAIEQQGVDSIPLGSRAMSPSQDSELRGMKSLEDEHEQRGDLRPRGLSVASDDLAALQNLTLEDTPMPQPAATALGGLGLAARRRMAQQLDRLAEQVQQLVSYAEDAAEARNLLWKIDLNLRQTRTAVQKLEEQVLRAPATVAPSRATLSDGFAKTARAKRNSTNTGSGLEPDRLQGPPPSRLPAVPDLEESS